MKGRKRTPTTLLISRGSRYAKRRSGEPIPVPGRPEAPAFVASDEVAAAEWDFIVGHLEQMGTLAIVNRMLIASYCLCVSRQTAAAAFIRENGMAYDTEAGRKKYPEVTIAEKCTEQIKAYMAEMCVTQASQSRATARKPEEKQDQGKKRFFAG